MSETKKEAVKAAIMDRQKFIARKLHVINNMENKAKARKLAERLLSK